MFLTERRAASHRVTAAVDLDPESGRARLSYEMGEQPFKQATKGKTLHQLHQLRHSRLTHLGDQNVSAPLLMAISGASLYAASGLSDCQPASCANLASNFLQQLHAAGPYQVLYLLGIMGIALAPAVIGLFWGTPLIARELETGTTASPRSATPRSPSPSASPPGR